MFISKRLMSSAAALIAALVLCLAMSVWTAHRRQAAVAAGVEQKAAQIASVKQEAAAPVEEATPEQAAASLPAPAASETNNAPVPASPPSPAEVKAEVAAGMDTKDEPALPLSTEELAAETAKVTAAKTELAKDRATADAAAEQLRLTKAKRNAEQQAFREYTGRLNEQYTAIKEKEAELVKAYAAARTEIEKFAGGVDVLDDKVEQPAPAAAPASAPAPAQPAAPPPKPYEEAITKLQEELVKMREAYNGECKAFQECGKRLCDLEHTLARQQIEFDCADKLLTANGAKVAALQDRVQALESADRNFRTKSRGLMPQPAPTPAAPAK